MSQDKKRSAIVAGATGLLGRRLILELLNNNFYKKIYVITRNSLQIENRKIEEFVVDFKNLDDLEIDIAEELFAFCVLGTTTKKSGKDGLEEVDRNYVWKFGALCSRLEVESFSVVSSIHASPDSYFHYLKTKGEMEHGLGKFSFPRLNIFRPSVLLGERKEKRKFEGALIAVSKKYRKVLQSNFPKYAPVRDIEVVKAMLSAAKNGRTGKTIYENKDIINLCYRHN